MINGRGVDVVQSSLTGEGLRASWNIIAPYGRSTELGREDIVEEKGFSIRPLASSG